MSNEAEMLYERAKILLEGKGGYDPAEVFALLYAASEQGYAEAQVKIGRYYHFGEITSQNFPKAAHYYSLAAKQYNANGLVRLAKCYLHDPATYGLEENTCEAIEDDHYYEKKAFALLKKAAKQDSASAFYEIADFLEQGKGGLGEREVGHAGDGFDEERKEGFLTIDELLRAKAIKMYLKAADLGSLQSQKKVFWYYLTVQIGDFYDTEKITYWVSQLLQNKDQTAQSLEDLGGRLQREAERIETMDHDRDGFITVPHYPNPNRSKTWVEKLYEFALDAYYKSFELGCRQSAEEAGIIRLFGPNSIRDEFRAYELFKKSGSDTYAAYCHAKGLGCTLNYYEATRLLEKSRDEMIASNSRSWGIDRVAFDLGQLYEVYGGTDYFAKAYESYCKGESSQCSYQIGMCHLLGNGVEKDEARAFETFRKASSQVPHTPIDSKIKGTSSGDRSAHGPYGLAICFYRGAGIEQSYDNAFYCLSRAVLRGKLHNKYICPTEHEVYRQSLFLLGLFWQNGLGVKKSPVNSSYFYSLAARLGHKESMLNLAEMLEQRSGNKISFDLVYEQYVYDHESDLLCAEHLRSVALILGTAKISDEDMPFAYYIEKDQRPSPDVLDGRLADASSFDWKLDLK